MFNCEVSMEYIQWIIFFRAMGIYGGGGGGGGGGIYYVYRIAFVILKYGLFDVPEGLLQNFAMNKNCNAIQIVEAFNHLRQRHKEPFHINGYSYHNICLTKAFVFNSLRPSDAYMRQ